MQTREEDWVLNLTCIITNRSGPTVAIIYVRALDFHQDVKLVIVYDIFE